MKCDCDVRNDEQIGHFADCALIRRVPTALDIFDQSLASLRTLWSDSPETLAMVIHRVSAHEEAIAALRLIYDATNRPNDLEFWLYAREEASRVLDREFDAEAQS